VSEPTAYTGPAPVARSAIGADAVGSPATARLTDESPLGKLLVRAPVDGPMASVLGTRFGRAVRDGDRLTVGSGPGEWLVLAPVADLPKLATWLEQQGESDPGLVSVVDLTHGRAMVRLTGPDAAGVLARVCAVDLSDRITPDGAAFRTSVARVATDVIRDDGHGGGSGNGGVNTESPSYLLHVERSSGSYLWDELSRIVKLWPR
jgi:heterotetrameric sarcosine oxidase gamma subunit